MVAPAVALSHNSSSKYPTIRGSEASDTQTPSDILVWNLNLEFNIVQLQTIMELIQHMSPEGSPLTALAQLRRQSTSYQQCARLVTIEESPPLVTDQMIERSVPKVTKHLRPVAIDVWQTKTCVSE
jgi:hypothetical protein